MKRSEVKELADKFLREATDKLSEISYETIQEWPEWPEKLDIDLGVPVELEKYSFGVMKDTQKDMSIRVAIQRYRYRFLGIGEMTADGFFKYPDGTEKRFTQEDIWEVT